MSLPKLNASLLAGGHPFPSDLVISPRRTLPERVLQFGEGNFLRAFVDWMIGRMNARGLFNGSVVLVQPIPHGMVEKINEQDGLYTVLLRGIHGGKTVEEKEIVTSVSRGVNPYTDFAGFLKCAENPDLRFVVSNTTEAGIAFRETDRSTDAPPPSFPGKLTAFLHHRFRHFAGASEKGCVMLPCELIERNGDTLKKTVFQTAQLWKLDTAFLHWLEYRNEFTNTLVDRIVTGFPRDELTALTAMLGYQDALLVAGEIFHSWVIESRWNLADELPLTRAGLDVIWTPNMTPYRDRKVRILNGAHSMMALAAYLAGKNTVGECMADEVSRAYVGNALHQEIIPTLDLPKDDLVQFAAAVTERFANPHIKHNLLSIALNSASKYRARVLPSVLEFQRRTGRLPPRLCFALAALMAFYRGTAFKAGTLIGERRGEEYRIADDAPVQEFFFDVWRDQAASADARRLVARVLAQTTIWGQDLNAVPGMTDAISGHLANILGQGVAAAMRAVA
ncbi:MAG TPA: tagaturonate reductase [Candidatus Methylomirabilis sp.]|nr:tagaturonate reductase [Candidatus Methylomirabilis sp.]